MDQPAGNFGPGFEGLQRTLPEDTAEYLIFVIDNKLSRSQEQDRLRSVQHAADELTKKLLKDYLWQRDPFHLDLKFEESRWVLRGHTNCGDSVADEWLIVYLLRELSKKFHDAWIRVYDADGEFLLIEAANALPRWLNPEVASNRVWIHSGSLKIIPLPPGSKPSRSDFDTSSKQLSLPQALSYITTHRDKLTHSPMIEAEAFYRIRNHPSAVAETLHRSLITIPRRLAHILRLLPSSVSPAVEAFYLRDPISLRPLLFPGHGGTLHFPPEDFVTVSVKFTKVSYAQLRSQAFTTPPAWKGKMLKVSNAKEESRIEMGMKLSCGFEMLLSDKQNRDRRVVREIQVLLQDLESGDEALPADDEIKNWPDNEDSDDWMNIDWEDFDRELSGRKGGKGETSSASGEGGFGDKAAQENLRKMVQRFEELLNDEDAGPEGVDVDEMDLDNDSEDESDNDEDKEVSYLEEDFNDAMRAMMGLPPEEAAKKQPAEPEVAPAGGYEVGHVEELDDSVEEIDAEAIRREAAQIEEELRAAGALSLDPPEEGKAGQRKIKGKTAANNGGGNETDSDIDGDEEVDIDYNLARNLLEALKGQAGMPGPARNLMGMMGMAMPRDEGEDEVRPQRKGKGRAA